MILVAPPEPKTLWENVCFSLQEPQEPTGSTQDATRKLHDTSKTPPRRSKSPKDLPRRPPRPSPEAKSSGKTKEHQCFLKIHFGASRGHT